MPNSISPTSETFPPDYSENWWKQHEDTPSGRIVAEVADRYKLDDSEDHIRFTIFAHLSRFARALGAELSKSEVDLPRLKRLSVLDLACGNKTEGPSMERFIGRILPSGSKRKMEPWLCRTLHVIGSHVAGVDINPLSPSEDWEFIQMDLEKPKNLKRAFRNRAFDVINMNYFILGETTHNLSSINAPEMEMLRRSNKAEYNRIVQGIISHSRALLARDGILIIQGIPFPKSKLK